MSYPKLIEHRGMTFRGHLSKKYNMVVYRTTNTGGLLYGRRSDTMGMLALGPGWQDSDRTWTPQDIFWEDKYDMRPERRKAALFTTGYYTVPLRHEQ